jgi:hypothetical protein
MILMPLKAKYRNKNFKIEKQQSTSGPIETMVVMASRFKSKTNNATKKNAAKKLRPRRRVYGPF